MIDAANPAPGQSAPALAVLMSRPNGTAGDPERRYRPISPKPDFSQDRHSVDPMTIRSILAGLAVALFAFAGLPFSADGVQAGTKAGSARPGDIKTVPADRDKGAWANNAAFVVIGSFRSEDRAKELVAAREDWGCKILSAEVKGKKQYRVAIGPFPKEVVKSALTQVEEKGHKDAWLLPAGAAGARASAEKDGSPS